eukprot:5873499-Pleurochrysis_carterae.AAC.2
MLNEDAERAPARVQADALHPGRRLRPAAAGDGPVARGAGRRRAHGQVQELGGDARPSERQQAGAHPLAQAGQGAGVVSCGVFSCAQRRGDRLGPFCGEGRAGRHAHLLHQRQVQAGQCDPQRAPPRASPGAHADLLGGRKGAPEDEEEAAAERRERAAEDAAPGSELARGVARHIGEEAAAEAAVEEEAVAGPARHPGHAARRHRFGRGKARGRAVGRVQRHQQAALRGGGGVKDGDDAQDARHGRAEG